VRGPIGGFLLRLARDSGLHFRIGDTRLAAFVSRIESRDSFFLKPLLPARNRWRRGPQRRLDLGLGLSVGQCENQARPKNITSRQST